MAVFIQPQDEGDYEAAKELNEMLAEMTTESYEGVAMVADWWRRWKRSVWHTQLATILMRIK